MPDPRELLLASLSGLQVVSWPRFRDILDTLWAGRPIEMTPSPNWEFRRYEAASTLDSLGHVDFDTTGSRWEVAVSPPTLALLPVRGLPQAVLCGARSTRLIEELTTTARGMKSDLDVRTIPQTAHSLFSPRLIKLQATDLHTLQGISEALSIRFARTPPAWSLAQFSASLEDYEASLLWEEAPDLGWKRWDFDPVRLRFAAANQDDDLRLSRYRHPQRPTSIYRVRKGNVSASVDPVWGRLLVLREHSRKVLAYHPAVGRLEIKGALRLPRLLARALVLCTGTVPQPSGDARALRERSVVYQGVSRSVAELVAAKVGQALDHE